MSEIYF